MSGDRVQHPLYGTGVILKARYKGLQLLVVFDDEIERWVRKDELTTAPRSVPTILPHGITESAKRPDNFDSRRMIEGFRLGIVPYDCAENFTFGRDNEIEGLVDWLDSRKQASLFLTGTYGTGKTHLLQYAYHWALREGYAVALVEMDPNEVPFYKPKRLYGGLVRSFKYPTGRDGRTEGFRRFVTEVIERGAFRDHWYFSKLVGKTTYAYLWQWIEAQESVIRPYHDGWIDPDLPALHDYSTAANIYCYLLSGLAWAAKEIMGLRGILLLLDEAESVSQFFYSYQSEKSFNFLKALIHTAHGTERLLEKPHKTGLDYCKQGIAKVIPFLYRKSDGLRLLFAFTEPQWITQPQAIREIDLEPLSDEALKEVFKNICDRYLNSYPTLTEGDVPATLFDEIVTKSNHTRLFVKATVEALDLIRFGNGAAIS